MRQIRLSTANGIIWTAFEKAVSQGLALCLIIILSRILKPEDFGLIGMISVILGISTVLVDSGMTKALVQKKDLEEHDYSTVFIFNLVISIIIYGILFFTAQYVSQFYKQPRLVFITQALGLSVIIKAFGVTQSARLIRNMEFKPIALISLASVFISGLTAIVAAYKGFGVWALVIQQLVSSIITVIGLYTACGVLRFWKFSISSFKGLFSFGFKLQIASINAVILQNVYQIILGRFFTLSTLGYYTRARRIADLSSGFFAQTINKVTYPLLCSISDNEERLVSVYVRVIKTTAFIIFPIMSAISLLAKPLIIVLLGESWLGGVFILQLLALSRITYPISLVNMNILNAIGRPDLFLKIDLLKVPIVLTVLAISIQYGLKAVIVGQLVVAWIGFFMDFYFPGKFLGYGASRQIKDMLPFIGMTAVSSLGIFIFKQIGLNPFFEIFGSVVCFTGIYIGLAVLFKINEFHEIMSRLYDIKLRTKHSS